MRVDGTAPASRIGSGAVDPLSGLGSDAFLKLLLAQLKHQDPLKPVDSTTQIAQLAQLSSLDQAVKQNERLDALLRSTAVSEALSVLGREVSAADGVAGRAVSAEVRDGLVVVRLHDGREITLGDGVKVEA